MNRDAHIFTDRHRRLSVRVRVYPIETQDSCKGWLYAYGADQVRHLLALCVEHPRSGHMGKWVAVVRKRPNQSNTEQPIPFRFVKI